MGKLNPRRYALTRKLKRSKKLADEATINKIYSLYLQTYEKAAIKFEKMSK